ncbi:hypothetical protein LINGRAHAP2_LOCUS14839 [Linum grandiflorum]
MDGSKSENPKATDVNQASDSSSFLLSSGKKARIAVEVVAAVCTVGFRGLIYHKKQQNLVRWRIEDLGHGPASNIDIFLAGGSEGKAAHSDSMILRQPSTSFDILYLVVRDVPVVMWLWFRRLVQGVQGEVVMVMLST